MKKRYKEKCSVNCIWSTEQDIYLIEHNQFPIAELEKVLPFNEEEIRNRREILGLVRRDRQMSKIIK